MLDVNGIFRSITVYPGAQFTIAPAVTLTVTH